MFPESGYIVNNNVKQYFRYKNSQGERALLNMISMNLWTETDSYIYVEWRKDIEFYKLCAYNDVTDLRRPHSA